MTVSDEHSHWSHVYEAKAPDAVSWYQPVPRQSLAALERLGASPTDSLIDVGGGASNLVDALVLKGWQDLTVLDIAEPALAAARSRLGSPGDQIDWVAADITRWKPKRTFDVWHDRAVFHFLTGRDQREAYLRALAEGTTARSGVIIASFALDGPERCSGLPVQRYDAAGLAREMGETFELLADWRDRHTTPWGADQSFTWTVFRRKG